MIIEELRRINDKWPRRAVIGIELTPEENLRLLQEIEANRAFILLAYQSDPGLLKLADPEIKRLFENVRETAPEPGTTY
ncbi:MAG: hypothetical protein WCR74_18465 [Betaproteobacteria bacterium]